MTLVVWWQFKKVDHRNFLSRSKVRIEYAMEFCNLMSKSQWQTSKRIFFPKLLQKYLILAYFPQDLKYGFNLKLMVLLQSQ